MLHALLLTLALATVPTDSIRTGEDVIRAMQPSIFAVPDGTRPAWVGR